MSSLRNGGTRISADRQDIYLRTGDSVAVVAELKDNQGNVVPAAGASWATGDATIADVRMDTVVVPGNYFTRGFIRGVTTTGGWTNVIVTVGSVQDTLRVVVMPANVTTSLMARTGTATTDTVVIPAQLGPPPVAAQTVIYSASDTLTVNGTSILNFDTSQVSVYITGPSGVATGYVFAKTPTQIKVVFTTGAAGKVIIKHLQLVSGNSSVGTIVLDSLVGDSTLLSRVRYRGTITQTGDTVTVPLANGLAFRTSTVVKFGASNGIVFDTAGGRVLSTVNYTGLVTLQGIVLGKATLNSITSTSPATVTLTGFVLTGAITQAGDTMTVTATGVVNFDSLTRVAVGTTKDSVFGFDATHLYVLAGTASTGTVNVTNAKAGSARIASLKTGASYTSTQATFPGTITQVGDTITVTGTNFARVDTLTTVSFGAGAGTVLSRGVNFVRVLWTGAPYTGAITVKNVRVLLTRIAALNTPASYTANQAQFLGTVVQVGDTMTFTAPANITFDASTGAQFGAGNAAIVLSFTATTLNVLSPVNYTGTVAVTGGLLGTVRIPAMTTAASFTIGGAQFPAANVSLGGGKLGDTITITAPAGYAFSTTAGKLAMVLAGNLGVATSDTAWLLSRTSSTIKAFAKRGGGGPVRITNVVIPGGLVVPYLTTPVNMPIDSVASDFPVGATKATARVATIPASKVDTVYGAVNATTIPEDFWTFTTTVAHVISASLAFYGTGNPYGAAAPNLPSLTNDLDLVVCTAAMACDESDAADLFGYSAASTKQPEAGTSTSQPAAQYWAGVIPFTPDGGRTVVYRLIITLQ